MYSIYIITTIMLLAWATTALAEQAEFEASFEVSWDRPTEREPREGVEGPILLPAEEILEYKIFVSSQLIVSPEVFVAPGGETTKHRVTMQIPVSKEDALDDGKTAVQVFAKTGATYSGNAQEGEEGWVEPLYSEPSEIVTHYIDVPQEILDSFQEVNPPAPPNEVTCEIVYVVQSENEVPTTYVKESK